MVRSFLGCRLQDGAAGERFLDIARQGHVLWERAHEIKQLDMRRTIRVAATETLNPAVLSRAYRRHIEEQPLVRLEITTRHTDTVTTCLKSGEADMGFVFRLRRSYRVTAPELYCEAWGIVCHEDCRFAQTHDAADLDPRLEVTRVWSPEWEAWRSSHVPEGGEGAVSVSSLTMLAGAMSVAGLWSIAPAGMARTVIKANEGLCFVGLHACPPPSPSAHVLVPKRQLPWVNDAVKTLIGYVADVAREDDGLTLLLP